MISLLIGIALSTLVSEDLASIGAGLLARDGHVSLPSAVGACIVGVYMGDLGLWGLGFLIGRHMVRPPWPFHSIDAMSVVTIRSQLERRLGTAVLASRFVPGSRLPTYVALGVSGRRPLAFAAWSLVAVMAWTPVLVIATAYFGDALVMSAVTGIRTGFLGSLLVAAAVLGATRLAGRVLARLVQRYHQRLAHTIETPN